MGQYSIDAERERLKDLLEAMQDELVRLIRARGQVETRIQKLQSDVVHIAAVCNVPLEDPITQLGLTDIIRYILANRPGEELLIGDIVEAMKRANYDVSSYMNIQANIHTILNRLTKAEEVRPAYGAGSSTRYRWIGGPPPQPQSPSWLKERLEKEQPKGKWIRKEVG